ncbi:hypothetical protein [Hymenobacter sp. HDW8]|uniref:hypothetical protein n=1 Tax=Hymenobacter sp. HDW8 TaxID=2714932 RepID=UPI00140B78B5|nr:hypothetical protein [Hymenobacter sp. HDW8]QIL75324.1 hypothetical protein G7064_05270 [Hymenobacter sp. HDW8]
MSLSLSLARPTPSLWRWVLLLVLLGCWLAVGYKEDFFREQLAYWQQRLVPSLQKAPRPALTTLLPAAFHCSFTGCSIVG